DAVPSVNGDDGKRERDDFRFGEMSFHFFEGLIRYVRFGNESERFSPREGGSFALGIKRRFAPGVEFVETLFGFAGGAGVFRMHVEAIRAAVNLRRAHFHEFEERFFEAGTMDVGFEGEHSLISLGIYFGNVDSGFHFVLLLSTDAASGAKGLVFSKIFSFSNPLKHLGPFVCRGLRELIPLPEPRGWRVFG